MKAKNITSNVLSTLFTPLLSATYLIAMILFYFPMLSDIRGLEDKSLAILYILIATTVFPFLLVIVLFYTKKIATLTLDDRRDRRLPQLLSCINYIAIYFFLALKFGYSDALTQAIGAVAVSTIVISFVNLFWKISTHATGIAGIFSIASILYFKYPSHDFFYPYIIICCLVVGVCMGRIHLKMHTPLQILAGLMLGMITGACFFLY